MKNAVKKNRVHLFSVILKQLNLPPSDLLEFVQIGLNNSSLSLEMLRFLIENGVVLTQWIVREIVESGKLEIVKFVYENNGDKKHELISIQNACEVSARNGFLEIFKYFESINKTQQIDDKFVESCLKAAVKKGHRNIIDYLMLDKENREILKSIGSALAFLACEFGNFELLKYLISSFDVKLDHLDKVGRNCLWVAIPNSNLEMVKFLANEQGLIHSKSNNINSLDTLLFHACSFKNNLDIVKFFVEKGANPNASQKSHTPLLIAIQQDNFETMKYLVTQGADVNLKIEGKVPLCAASRSGNLEIVKYLVEHGATVNAKDSNGYCALYWAFNPNRYGLDIGMQIVKYLVEVGNADLNVTDNQGQSLIYLACISGNKLDFVKYFIQTKKVNINLASKFEDTPLLYACSNNKLETVKCLIEEGGASIGNKEEMLKFIIFGASSDVFQYFVEKCGFDQTNDLIVALSIVEMEIAKNQLSKLIDLMKISQFLTFEFKKKIEQLKSELKTTNDQKMKTQKTEEIQRLESAMQEATQKQNQIWN